MFIYGNTKKVAASSKRTPQTWYKYKAFLYSIQVNGHFEHRKSLYKPQIKGASSKKGYSND